MKGWRLALDVEPGRGRHDGTFYELVPTMTEAGPLAGHAPRRNREPQAEYSLALARDGYALVKCELAVFCREPGVNDGRRNPWPREPFPLP